MQNTLRQRASDHATRELAAASLDASLPKIDRLALIALLGMVMTLKCWR
jgi:hypothetical protein